MVRFGSVHGFAILAVGGGLSCRSSELSFPAYHPREVVWELNTNEVSNPPKLWFMVLVVPKLLDQPPRRGKNNR